MSQDHDVASFRLTYSDWCRKYWSTSDLVYALPPSALNSLSRPLSGTMPAFLDGRAAEAESAFSAMCMRQNAVGFRSDMPIQYLLFRCEPAQNDPHRSSAISPISPALLKTFNELLEGARTIQKAFVGRLWCNPVFLEELGSIRTALKQCPGLDRVDYPLHRLMPAAATARGKNRASAMAVDNYKALARFLDRWSLMSLTTWDLPYPQGQLDSNPFPLDSPALPANGVRTYIPTYYPVDAGRLRQSIESLQNVEARRVGMPVALAPLGEVKTYATVAEIVHLERTIRSRQPNQKRGGIAAHIETAATKLLKLGRDRVRALRKLIPLAMKTPYGNVGSNR